MNLSYPFEDDPRAVAKPKPGPGGIPVVAQAPQVVAAEAPKPDLGSATLADYGKVAAAGGLSLGQGLAHLGNVATGGALERVTGAEGYLADQAEGMRQSLSPRMQAARAKEFITDDLSLGPAWTDPHAIGSVVVENLPMAAATMLPAARAASVAKSNALKAGVTEAMANQAAQRAGAVVGGATEGAISGGMNASEAGREIRGMEEDKIGLNPKYQAMLASGKSPGEARDQLAREAERDVGLITGAVTGLTGAWFGKYLGKLVGEGSPSGRVVAGLKGGAIEGGTEVAQSGAEQVVSNAAVQQYGDPSRELLAGVPNAMAAGLVGGGVTGGGMAAAFGAPPAKAPQVEPTTQVAPQVDAAAEAAPSPLRAWSDDPENARPLAEMEARRPAYQTLPTEQATPAAPEVQPTTLGGLGLPAPDAGLATTGERFPLSFNVANLARPAATQQLDPQPVTAADLGMDPNAGLADAGTPPAEPLNLASMVGPRATMDGLGMPAVDAGLGTQVPGTSYSPTPFITREGIQRVQPSPNEGPVPGPVETAGPAEAPAGPMVQPGGMGQPSTAPETAAPQPGADVAVPESEGVPPVSGGPVVGSAAPAVPENLAPPTLANVPAWFSQEDQAKAIAEERKTPDGGAGWLRGRFGKDKLNELGMAGVLQQIKGAARAEATQEIQPNAVEVPAAQAAPPANPVPSTAPPATAAAVGPAVASEEAAKPQRLGVIGSGSNWKVADADADQDAPTALKQGAVTLQWYTDQIGGDSARPAAADNASGTKWGLNAATKVKQWNLKELRAQRKAVEDWMVSRLPKFDPSTGEPIQYRKDLGAFFTSGNAEDAKPKAAAPSTPKPTQPTTEEVAAKAREVVKRKAAKQRAVMEIDPKVDDLLAAIAKAGGLNAKEAEAQGIDPAHFAKRGFRIYRVFTKGGDTFDGMAERLNQYGYPVTEVDGTYSPNALLEALSAALDGGKRQIAAAGADAKGERLLAQAQNRGPDVDWATFDEWTEEHQTQADEERMTALRNWGVGALGQDAFEDLEADVSARVGDAATDAEFMNALEEAINEAVNQREGQAEPGRDEGVGGFALEGQAQADIQRQEAARREAERAAADARARDQVEGPESFVLTGSKRPADELAARGQTDLLDAIGAAEKAPAKERAVTPTREAAEILAKAKVVKTNRNSHVVWQILTEDGQVIQGPRQAVPERPELGMIMGAIGWQTKREATRVLDGLRAGAQVKEDLPATTPAPKGNKPAADKLRKVAGPLAEKAEAALNADRLANTPKRARMAAGAAEAARKDEAMAKTMLRLADGIEAGEAKLLANVSARAAVEMLNDAVNAATYRRQQSQNLSYAEIERQKGRPAEQADITFAKLPAAKADDPQWYKDEVKTKRDRFARLGITSDTKLRAALTEFLDYMEGAKKEDPIAKAERALVGVKAGFDYFPTPKPLAARMAEMAGIKPGMRVLEPSAGNGNLADAAKAAGAQVDAVEVSDLLRNVLEAKGYPLVGRDFEDFTPTEKYDAIIMNPPFFGFKDVAHVRRAWDMLKPGGTLVAITGEGAHFRDTKVATDFRGWLDEHDATVEKLPPNTFKGADLQQQTGTNARLVVMKKPGTSAPAPDRPSTRFNLDRVIRPANAPAGKLEVAMLQARLDAMVGGWKGLSGVAVRVVQDEADLPASVAREAEAIRGSDPGLRPRGVFVPGTGSEANQIVLVANNLKDVNEAFTVLAHEAIGHLGVRQVFGDGMAGMLDMLAAERAEQVALFADIYKQDMASEEGRRVAAEEYLAHLAENPDNLTDSSVLRRVIQYVRQFLRGIGVKLTLTDNDIREILVGARKYITEGGRSRGGMAARFSFENSKEMKDAPPPANAGDLFAQDMQAQAAWLEQQAKAAGFESADDLAIKEPVRFIKLAEEWRAAHPWPKKAAPRRKTPRLRRGVERMMQDAESHKSWKNWYDRHVETLRDLFEEDADLFRDLLAITSQGNGVASNVTLALKAYRQIKLGLQFEGLALGQANVEKYARGEPIGGLKIGAFAQALAGVEDAVVTDRHMARYLFGVDQPTKAQHAKANNAIKAVARRLGWTPREVQAALWAFQQHTTGVPKANDYEAALRRKIQEIRALRQELVGLAGGPGGEGGGAGARFSLGASEQAGGGARLSPNGRPSNLNPRQWAQVRTPEFKAWFGDSKVVAADGSPLVVYHGTSKDFVKFDDREVIAGFHFGTSEQANMRVAGAGKNIMPVYLSISNPQRSKDTGGKWAPKIKAAKSNKHDGIVYLNRYEGIPLDAFERAIQAVAKRRRTSPDRVNLDDLSDSQFKALVPEARDSWIAFSPTQIKSAIGNTGAFSPTNPDIRFSLANPALASALRKAGLGVDDRSLIQRIKDWAAAFWADLTGNFKDRVIEGAFDRFHGIKLAELAVLGNLPAEQSGYVASRLSTGASSVLYGMLTHGAPEWRDGILSMKEGSKGVLQILEPVKDNLTDYLGWMVGVRAKRLMSEGKENNLTSEEIEELLALADGKEETFEAVAADLDAFKKSVLDVAQEAGLIDGETRPAWDHADYIPFYREATEGRVKGPFAAKGLSHQSSGIKKLRGGAAAIHDPLENLMRNFGHLVDASMKNMALRRVTSNLDGSEFLTEIPSAEFERSVVPLAQVKTRLLQFGMDPKEIDALPADALGGFAKLWSVKAPDRPNVVRVMDGGKARYFEVADPALLRGLTAVNQEAFGGPVKVMREFKRLLTAGVTSDPSFWGRSAIRDAMHAWTINEDGFRFGIDSVRGAMRAFKEDGGLVDMLFAGASFQSGHLNANDPEAMADAIRQALSAKGFSKRQADDYMKTVVLSAEDLWRRYRRIGDAVENASREAVFEAAGKAGKSRAEQVFEAKDLMDYSMQGNWTLIRLMGDVLPFFNARLQGLYKLGRAGAVPGINTKKKAVLRGGMIMAASILLLMLNKDREEYEELEDWDKDSNWHFWIGGEHIRIPKPFEIGLLYGTLPERITRSALGRDDGGKTLDRLWQGIYSTLEVNPIPQMFRPLAETWANRNMFTGRSIENQADEGKLPSARYNEGTSPTMRSLGALTSDTTGLSPKELEHLWRGYLGAMGAYALGAADMIHRLANGQDALPEARTRDIPVIGSFWRSGQASNSRYTTEFYDMLREVEQIYRTANAYKKEGDPAKARDLRQREANKLSTRKILTGANEKIRNINKRIDQARRDQTLSVEERTRRVDELNAKKLDLAKRIVERVEDRF